MALTNNLKKLVDLPIFELCSQLPTNTTALTATTTSDEDGGRYIYVASGAVFCRYDAQADTWQYLAPPNIAATTVVDIKYSTYNGYRGNILGSTSNTVTIPALRSQMLVGKKIRIISGTGAGQERTITAVGEDTIWDTGLATTASATQLGDSTKRWTISQWVGYQVRVVYGTGQTQVRRVLYNDPTTLTFSDTNFQQLDPWSNTGFSAVSPYALPVTTAGSQAVFYIESTDVTVDTPWTVQPDESSSFVVLTGGVWMISSAASSPFSSFQYYDILSDTWYTRTPLGGLLTAALGTDIRLERTGEAGGTFKSGTATSGGARTLTDTTMTGSGAMIIDDFCNYRIKITGGTGMGQSQRIVANGTNYFEVATPWTTIPDATSTYTVYADTNVAYLMGNNSSTMYQYHAEQDLWTLGDLVDYGICRNISIQYPGQEAFSLGTGTRYTGAITALNPTPTAGGTGYAVGDLFNITTGGTLGKGRVEEVNAGVVTKVSLYAAGNNYTTGAGKATTVISGTGSGTLTVEITSTGTVGRMSTSINHNLCVGDSVTISGCTESAWNTIFTILTVDGLSTFEIRTTATASPAATTSQGTSTIVDATKNWAVNEHVGKIVTLQTAGTTPTTQQRRIISNTANTLTVATIVAGVDGSARYTICQPSAFGRTEQWEQKGYENWGHAVSGTTTTLVDNSKTWYSNQWAGYKVRIIAGAGVGSEIAITSNTSTTLTYASQTFTPDSTTKYIIMDSFGIATAATNTTNATITDTTKNWKVNCWAGRRLRVTAGTGIGQEITITSNTATVITCNGTFTTGLDTTSMYTILGIATRGTGLQLNWLYNNAIRRGRILFCLRGGGANSGDSYLINQGIWRIDRFLSPQSETFTTGSMSAYDGNNKIYLHKDATGRIYALDINTLMVDGGFQLPVAHAPALIGNRMEIIETEDGLKYLYIMQHTGTLMWRGIII